MDGGCPSIDSMDELREFVRGALCRRENLLADQFVLYETPLMLGERPCGVQFTLQGPRSVRLGAVWAADRNELYLYDARGERFAKVRIQSSMRLAG